MTSVGDMRAVVLGVADEVPLAQAASALDELERRAQALQARLRDSGDQDVDVAVRQLSAAADRLRTVTEALGVAADLCRSYVASV